MAKIHINIGSNQNRRSNISTAIEALKLNFLTTQFSDVFVSPAYGFKGDDFYNVGVNASTDLPIAAVIEVLHFIENNQGRDRAQAKFSSRLIDLDLVLYDGVVDAKYNLPRGDILKHNFVLLPLAQLSPAGIHPLAKKTYLELSATLNRLKSYNIEILNRTKK